MKTLVSKAIRRWRRRNARRRSNPNSGVPSEGNRGDRRRAPARELQHDGISVFRGQGPFHRKLPREFYRRVSNPEPRGPRVGPQSGSWLKELLLSSLYIVA